MSKDTNNAELELKDVFARVRGQVKRLLERDASPADISYVLSFVAIELGLSLTEDAARVFPVVLKGASHAATSYADHKQGKAASEALQSLPVGASIH
jgi:hypothetical protein